MNLNDWSRFCYTRSDAAGWWESTEDEKFQIGTKFALIHSEVSEAFEGYRKDAMDSHLPNRKAVEVELADVLIRVFDLAGRLDLDLQGAVEEKLEYNRERADHRAEARSAPGGKRF